MQKSIADLDITATIETGTHRRFKLMRFDNKTVLYDARLKIEIAVLMQKTDGFIEHNYYALQIHRLNQVLFVSYIEQRFDDDSDINLIYCTKTGIIYR